jgi:cytochrome c oxidase subunit 2
MRRTDLVFKAGGSLAVAMLALCWAWTAIAADSEDRAEEADRVISIVAERFTFVPSRIKLRQGEVVELRIRSLDTNHGFYLRDAGVNVIVPKRGKGDARILFRAREKGVFPFECSKACGAGHTMMRGRIVVE